MRHQIGRYGWIPDLPDARDRVFAAPRRMAIPKSVDLRASCPQIYDQGDLSSCTANAIAAAIQFDQIKEKLKQTFTPSRLFIYYNERAIEGTVASDNGAMLRDGIKTIASQGACAEPMWPYVEQKFADRPAAPCYSAAKLHPAVEYSRVVQDPGQMKACLAAGYPFVFGFTVYESFESEETAHTGVAEMPQAGEASLGGHAVMAVGYDDGSQRFLVRNSWGASWGMGGYFTMPYAYAANEDLAADFWTIRVVR